MPALDLADVQGLILRGYNMPTVRYLVLRIDQPESAKRFLAGLVNGDAAASPQIATAAPWQVKPAACLNLGVTFQGLKALRLSEDSLASFPEEFRQGAVAQAASLGNTGDSAPENWIGGLNTPEAHVLLSLFAQKDAELARVT